MGDCCQVTKGERLSHDFPCHGFFREGHTLLDTYNMLVLARRIIWLCLYWLFSHSLCLYFQSRSFVSLALLLNLWFVAHWLYLYVSVLTFTSYATGLVSAACYNSILLGDGHKKVSHIQTWSEIWRCDQVWCSETVNQTNKIQVPRFLNQTLFLASFLWPENDI